MPDNPNIDELIRKSFLNRVPEIMIANPEITLDQAVKLAFDQEESLCLSLIGGRDQRSEVANTIVHELSNAVYRRLRGCTHPERHQTARYIPCQDCGWRAEKAHTAPA